MKEARSGREGRVLLQRSKMKRLPGLVQFPYLQLPERLFPTTKVSVNTTDLTSVFHFACGANVSESIKVCGVSIPKPSAMAKERLLKDT